MLSQYILGWYGLLVHVHVYVKMCIGSSGHLKVVCEWIFPIETFQIFFSDHVTLGVISDTLPTTFM